MGEYNVTFNGYRLDRDKSGLPTYGGIYLVYCCIYSAETNRVTLNRLIYIGQSVNICDRVNNHDRYEDFKAELRDTVLFLCIGSSCGYGCCRKCFDLYAEAKIE